MNGSKQYTKGHRGGSDHKQDTKSQMIRIPFKIHTITRTWKSWPGSPPSPSWSLYSMCHQQAPPSQLIRISSHEWDAARESREPRYWPRHQTVRGLQATCRRLRPQRNQKSRSLLERSKKKAGAEKTTSFSRFFSSPSSAILLTLSRRQQMTEEKNSGSYELCWEVSGADEHGLRPEGLLGQRAAALL